MHRVRELVIYGANDNLPDESRLALGRGGSNIEDWFSPPTAPTASGIFAGHKTTEAPLRWTSLTVRLLGFNTWAMTASWGGDRGRHCDDYNLPGDQVFRHLHHLIQVRIGSGQATVKNCRPRACRGDKVHRRFASLAAGDRGQSESAEMTWERMTDFRLNVQKPFPKRKTSTWPGGHGAQNGRECLSTALASGARIIQPSLLDFLR